MHRRWLWVRLCHTHLMLHPQEKNGDIITFAQFEEENLSSETQNLLSENRDNEEINDEYDDDSIMPPLISEE